MEFPPHTDYPASFSHSSSLDNPLLGSAEPYGNSDPDNHGVPFPIPYAFWSNFFWDGTGFDHSLFPAYSSSPHVLGPSHQAALSSPIPVSAPAPAAGLSQPPIEAYPNAHIVSDQAPNYHASSNAGLASPPWETIGLHRMIGVENAYSGLPHELSDTGHDDRFHPGLVSYQQPGPECHHEVQNWRFVAKQAGANLNSANLRRLQDPHGVFHPNPDHLSQNIINIPALPKDASLYQSLPPVGDLGQGISTDHAVESSHFQTHVDEPTGTEFPSSSPQEDICNWVIPIREGHDEHSVDRESTALDHFVGVQSPFEACGSLIPYSTSRTPESRDDAPTPPLSTDATTPSSTGNSSPPTPGPTSPKVRRKSQPATFQFVQYTAGSDTGDRTSKKRLAYGEDDQNASSNIVTQDVLRDQEGTVKGIQIVFHHREKTSKKVRRTEEEKRTSALARKNGVCDWCKSKKRKVKLYFING